MLMADKLKRMYDRARTHDGEYIEIAFWQAYQLGLFFRAKQPKALAAVESPDGASNMVWSESMAVAPKGEK